MKIFKIHTYPASVFSCGSTCLSELSDVAPKEKQKTSGVKLKKLVFISK